jgi:hypothetical protein
MENSGTSWEDLDLSGRELKSIRELGDYTARDIIQHLQSKPGRFARTVDGWYAVEKRGKVQRRYIRVMKEIMGKEEFTALVGRVLAQRAGRSASYISH